MGLLDSFTDPQSMAVLQLAGGLLSPGSFGQGLSRGMQGYQQSLMNTQDIALKKQQVLSAQQEQQVRDLQIRQSLQKLALGDQFLGGGNSGEPAQASPASTASTAMGLGAQSGSIGPTMDNAQRMNSLPQMPTTVTPQQQSKLASMTQDQIAAGVVSGVIPKELVELWTNAKFGRALPPGWKQDLNGSLTYVPDPTKGVTMGPDGKTVMQMPGAAESLGGVAGAIKAAETQGVNENTLASLDRIDPATGRPYNMTVGGIIRQIRGDQPVAASPASLGDFDPAMQARIQASMRRNGDTNVAFQKAAPASVLPPSMAIASGGFGGFQGPAEAAAAKLTAEKGVNLQMDPLIDLRKDMVTKAHGSNQAFMSNLGDIVNNEADIVARNNRIAPLLAQLPSTGGFGYDKRVDIANSIKNSGLAPQKVLDGLASTLINGDPAAAKAVANQLSAAAIQTMLDTLNKEGKPNRVMYQALHEQQEGLANGKDVLRNIMDLQKKLYEQHLEQLGKGAELMTAPDYNPIKFQYQFATSKSNSIGTKPADPGAAPSGTFKIIGVK